MGTNSFASPFDCVSWHGVPRSGHLEVCSRSVTLCKARESEIMHLETMVALAAG